MREREGEYFVSDQRKLEGMRWGRRIITEDGIDEREGMRSMGIIIGEGMGEGMSRGREIIMREGMGEGWEMR